MIETRVSWITLIDDNTLRIEYKPDAYIDVAEFEENRQAYRRLMKTEKVFIITIANQGAESSPEVRKLFSTPERSAFKFAEAFVISSLAQRIIASFVIRVQKPAHPIAFFNSEKDAMKWLDEQKIKMGTLNSEKAH